MTRPRCEKCQGALWGEAGVSGELVVTCLNCGWSVSRVGSKVYAALPVEGLRNFAQTPKAMAAKRADQGKICRTCGRLMMIQSGGKCYRCRDRIERGVNPMTGQKVGQGGVAIYGGSQ